VKCRGENALGRSATARVGILVEGQTITVIRVGNSYNRTVARVRLAAGDVGSELMATGAARSRR
jgi:endonuclease YncB( thermonuclease family)